MLTYYSKSINVTKRKLCCPNVTNAKYKKLFEQFIMNTLSQLLYKINFISLWTLAKLICYPYAHDKIPLYRHSAGTESERMHNIMQQRTQCDHLTIQTIKF